MVKLNYGLGLAFFLTTPQFCFGQGSTFVRVDDTSGSHCIDATTEEISIHVRRIFTEKTKGLFTEDNRAGVLTTAKLTGRGDGKDTDAQIPSIDLVTVKDEQKGRISLPLEYEIASYLPLKKDGILTTDMELSIRLAKTRGKTTFGAVLDLAGKFLSQVSIPSNPYVNAASKFLKFANGAIRSNCQPENG